SFQMTQSESLMLHLDPTKMNFANYTRVFKTFDFFNSLKNSIIVSGSACLINCLVSSMAAYGFAKKKFPGRDMIFNMYLATLMIPSQVTLIPVFTLMRKMGMLNTYPCLFLPVCNAFGVFLIKQFMSGVPDELLEAAEIDGCGEVRKFVSIVVPLIKPVLISLTVFTFITTWNDFIWPLVATTDKTMHTLTLALSVLKGNYSTNYGLVMAGSALAFMVPFTLYIFLQKQFVEGIAMSGVKG
ncbi:MAG: carbohydrate ABC transporter permease, partial [Christensenella sp.]